MKVEIKSRWSGTVIFTAEIEAAEDTPTGVRLGLAVKAAVKAKAYLSGANLSGADLSRAYLSGANLSGADLNGLLGLNDWIKCIQIEDWPISYTSEVMQIGCQRHALSAWRDFDDATIARMDGRRALQFWRKWKAWIFQTIEMAPAKPTMAPSQEPAAPAIEQEDA